jgi:hypothetical protein
MLPTYQSSRCNIAGRMREAKEKAFFFEKKKQKTFAPALSLAGA